MSVSAGDIIAEDDVNSFSIPPGVTVFLVILTITVLLLVGILMWYFLSGRAREVSKLKNIEMQSLVSEKSIEKLRKSHPQEDQDYSDKIMSQSTSHLEVLRPIPRRSPSIFAGEKLFPQSQLSGSLSSKEKSPDRVDSFETVSKVRRTSMASAQVKISRDSIDLSGVGRLFDELDDSHMFGSVNSTDFQCPEEYDEVISTLSMNVFYDCNGNDIESFYSPQLTERCSPSHSFRSVVDSIHTEMSSDSVGSPVSAGRITPMVRLQFEDIQHYQPWDRPKKSKKALCAEVENDVES